MGGKSKFRNWMVEAYKDGRVTEIPADILPLVKEVAEKREEKPSLKEELFKEAAFKGWGEVEG